jgi:hypothetical protein
MPHAEKSVPMVGARNEGTHREVELSAGPPAWWPGYDFLFSYQPMLWQGSGIAGGENRGRDGCLLS